MVESGKEQLHTSEKRGEDTPKGYLGLIVIFFRITKTSPVSDTIDIDVCSYADIQQ